MGLKIMFILYLFFICPLLKLVTVGNPIATRCGQVTTASRKKLTRAQYQKAISKGSRINCLSLVRKSMQRQQGILTSFTTQSKSALMANYMVAFHIACSKKAFTIVEELILPCYIDMCWEIIGEAVAAKFKLVSLSNNTTYKKVNPRNE